MGPHANTQKEKPRSSLLDPPADERERERRAGGQSLDGYLAIGERGYSMLRHLPMVVGLVPVARGGLVVRGGARVVNGRGPQNSPPRNSHRDERDHSRTPVLILRACSGIFIRLPRETHTALALLCSRTDLLSDTTSANPTTILRVSEIYISSHLGSGLGENHLAVRPSLAHGHTPPGRSRAPCSETPHSPRGSALEE